MPTYLVPAILTGLALVSAGTAAVIAFASGLTERIRGRALAVFALGLGLWMPAMMAFASAGAFLPGEGPELPLLPLAAAVPVVLMGLALVLSGAVRRFADGLDQRSLVALQGLRVIGGVFVLLWVQGQMPWQFALPAGLGDFAVGVLALVALGRMGESAESDALWIRRVNIAGISDFVLAVSTGLMTMPGATNLMAGDAPNLILASFPVALVPAIGVPLFSIGHLLSVRLAMKARARRQQPA